MSTKILDAEALNEENLMLHRRLAAAELDAHTAWSRYEGANNARKANEQLLAAKAVENQVLAQALTGSVRALQDIDSIMQILYEGGFHQQMLSYKLADRREFEKILGLAQNWLRLGVPANCLPCRNKAVA